MSPTTLSYEVTGRVARITLDRPERANAITLDMPRELAECVEEANLVMIKLLVNQALYSQGLQATQALGVFFDGIARHTPEGYKLQRRAAEAGFKEAVRERDEPCDPAQSPP
jgi:1,4-dihydroxy-2-naphthoyl-CoA synthase